MSFLHLFIIESLNIQKDGWPLKIEISNEVLTYAHKAKYGITTFRHGTRINKNGMGGIS